MKKTITGLFVIFLVLGLSALYPQAGYAQNPTPTATLPADIIAVTPTAVTPAGTPAPVLDSDTRVSFRQLGLNDRMMRGPYDTMNVYFASPINWVMQEVVEVQLVIDPQYTSLDGKMTQGEIWNWGASLEVTFNNYIITRIPLNWTGERTVSIPVPLYMIQAPLRDGRHELYLFLDAAHDCDVKNQTTVNVKSTSGFVLPHKSVTPALSLSALPRPLYQQNQFIRSQALIIVPDKPSASEVRAAAIVAGGFGRMTNGTLLVSLVPASKADTTALKNVHAIFVGKPETFTQLKQVTLPAPVDGKTFQAPGAGQDDGVIQLAPSPWSPNSAVLVISGSTDTGVIKAAQAVSSGSLRVAGKPDLVLVADVLESIEEPLVAVDRTFADLGYKPEILTGIGTQEVSYVFFIPPGQVAQADSYLDLIFNNSAMIDFNLSGMSILLNDQIIGSVRYDETTTKIKTVRVDIPPYAVHAGNNILTIQVDHMPFDSCSQWNLGNLWTSISNTSLLHIPLGPAQATEQAFLNLGVYPYPFISSPTLGSTALIVPSNDARSWNTAIQLAGDLGRKTYGALVDLDLAFADAIPEDILNQKDLLIIGKAADLPIIQTLAKVLPAPFEAGKNIATERSFRIIYRLPEGTSLGYLELLPSPWSTNHTIVTALGSTDDGLVMAGAALTNAALRSKLAGDFAVVQGEQVLTADSRFKIGTGNISATAAPASATAQPAPTLVSARTVAAAARPTWILPAIIASGAALVLLVLWLLFRAIFRRRTE